MDKSEVINSKIYTRETLSKKLAFWKFSDKKIVFTNGCFDLLHLGHVDYLAKAASMGDVLIVGLNTDASVSKLKGPYRPLNNEYSRSVIMASLFFVKAVILFDEPTPIDLIKLVQPDILVKGGDYKVDEIVGYHEVTSSGGEVRTIDLVPGISTTSIIDKILKSGA